MFQIKKSIFPTKFIITFKSVICGLHFTYYYEPKAHLSIREIEPYKGYGIPVIGHVSALASKQIYSNVLPKYIDVFEEGFKPQSK